MSAGRLPRIGIPWSGSLPAFPAPTLYLPLRTDLLDDSGNGYTNESGSVPTIDSGTSSPIGSGCASFVASSNQFLQFGDATDLDFGTGDWFIAFWAYNSSTGNTNSYPTALAKGEYQSSTGAWAFFNNRATPDGMNFGYGNPWVEGTLLTGSANFPDNTWAHIYVQRSGNTMTFRSDAVSRGTLDVTGVSFDNSHVLRVGNDLGGDAPWQGFIQDLVYCRGSVLTAGQVTALQTASYASLL